MISTFRTHPSLAALIVLMELLISSCQARSQVGHLSVVHPDDVTKQVEYFFARPSGPKPWPTVVLLHGNQDAPRPGGKVFVDWGVLDQLAKRGYLAVAVSEPGHGNSTGSPDFCGPFTQHAVSAVLAKLRADGDASPTQVVIEGISRGAVTAGLIAAHDPSISGVVLISGVYDFPAYISDPAPSDAKTSVISALRAVTGATDEALRTRSLLYQLDNFKAAALVLNGAKDDRTDPAQASRLAAELTRKGRDARAIIYPDYGHMIPVEVRNKDIDPFIDRLLRPKG